MAVDIDAQGLALRAQEQVAALEAQLPRWKANGFLARLAQVRAGTGRARIVVAGDSTVAGFGAGNADVGNRALSWPTLLAAFFEADGIVANTASFWGTAGRQNDAGYDPRLVRGSGWVADPFSVTSFGGPVWYNNSSTEALAFSPMGTFDRADIYTVSNTTQGVMAVDIGGATVATIDAAGSPGLVKTSVSFARGIDPTLRIRRDAASGGASVRVVGAVLHDSQRPAVEIYNGGWSGVTAANLNAAANPWDYRAALATIAPDLTLTLVGLNDMNPANVVSVASYAENRRQVLAAARLSGDAIELLPNPASAALTPLATQADYVEAARAVAREAGVPVVDLPAAFVSYAAAAARGLYYDIIHPGSAGQWLIAREAYKVIDAL